MSFQNNIFWALLVTLITALLICTTGRETRASSLFESVSQLNVIGTKTFDEIKHAVDILSDSHAAAIKKNNLNFDLQKLILTKSGECINTIVSLHKNSEVFRTDIKVEERKLFLQLRNNIKKILVANEKIIWELQEKTLDQLDDPSAFFKSSKWQNPQYLISLSSYWLGWNGYYGSLMFSENDPMKNVLLNEAIKGFSRAFIDFHEDAVIVRSLFGRGLCYSQLKAYKHARRDLKIVQKRVNKDDPIYFRCVYEDTKIAYQTGNFEMALRILNEIKEDFPREAIPLTIAESLENLRSKVLIAVLEKQDNVEKGTQKVAGQRGRNMFNQLKSLAINPTNIAEFYRYVQDHADSLEALTYAELGPVAAVALGDLFFDKKNYERALQYYLPIRADFPSFLDDRKDGVWFRMAYIYCKKEEWDDAIELLKRFYKVFPDSPLIGQAASLYYTASTHHYKKEGTQSAYNLFIDAARVFTNRSNAQGASISEAHFNLGKHYQKTGETQAAIAEFSQVKEDSPNFITSRYHALQCYIDTLESLEKISRQPSTAAARMYEKASRTLREYRVAIDGQKVPVNLNEIKPHMTILESRLLTYGPVCNCKDILKKLTGFEKRFPREEKLFSKVFYLRMICYHRLGIIEKAKEEVNRFTEFRPLDKEQYALLQHLADTFYQEDERSPNEHETTGSSREMDMALIIYSKLYSISCNKLEYRQYCESAQLGMARIYNNKNQLDQAEALYLDIIKKKSLSADALYNLGLLYEAKGQWEDALAIWRRFSDGVETGTYYWFESRYKTAWAHMKLMNNDKACDILTMTLVLHPDFGNDELKNKYVALRSKICKERP